jgi:hypothetical protein
VPSKFTPFFRCSLKTHVSIVQFVVYYFHDEVDYFSLS